MNAEMERRRAEVEAYAAEIQAAISDRSKQLLGTDAELANLGSNSSARETLEEQKLRLEREKVCICF
jgi:hypothetical protein